MHTLRNNQSGLTIIELVITITVGAILVLSSTIIINNMIRANGRARDLAVATAAAENKAEELRSVGYVGLSNGTFNFDTEIQDVLGSSATASYVISDEPVAAGGLKRINISISYNDFINNRTLTYETLIGELGVAQY